MRRAGRAFLLIILAAFASPTLAAEIPAEAGYHGSVALPGRVADNDEKTRNSNTYELYLPKGYGEQKETRHPVVIVLGSTPARTKEWINEQRLPEWAEGVKPPAIILGVNRIFNAGTGVGFGSRPGEPPIAKEEGMDDYWALLKKIPGAHPTMRFLVSFPSGGSGDSQRVTALSLKSPDRIAGFVLGPHPYAWGVLGARDTTFKLNPDISVAVLDVTLESYARGRPTTPYTLDRTDNFDPALWEQAYIGNLRKGGNPFMRVESMDWRMRDTSLHESFWFLVDCGWQVKAGVTAAERAAGKKQMIAAMEKAAEIEDARDRERRYRTLLAVPGAAEWPEAKACVAAWHKSVLESVEARKEPLIKYFFLEQIIRHPLIKKSPDTLAALTAKLTQLNADAAFKREWMGREAVRAAAKNFSDKQSFGQDPAGLDATIAAFEKVEKNFDGTLASKEAHAWLEFLVRRRDELKEAERKRNGVRDPVQR